MYLQVLKNKEDENASLLLLINIIAKNRNKFKWFFQNFPAFIHCNFQGF